ncbi:DNA polymerase III subunit gamma and tau [Tessaracoccus sp. OH4464_COT-324]|nr:DNA polymerase III subunit gamma and tau [Tessaracoccus sp. OH4464_COT-324]RRD47215.1 DNA polymerase III subunit gamma and tau [Tessaracoccus sp. OH4464_COT-324]
MIQDGPDLFGNEFVPEQPQPEPVAPSEPEQAAAEPVARGAAEPEASTAARPEPELAPPPSKLGGKRPDIPDAPLALYRRYRPDTFGDVIGQEHVTVPLQRALDNNRVGHAYLFSGPRGCGKTTSARILARCLNCEQGPTATPCGECQSCIDLARGGPGSIDVIEIDAASHGGVDDARDLRERAFFAPVSSRYKIYIVDEAHMVTAAGFNALLKLVEEPPPHAKFIFATTEPEKVIGTIRSRTHHYPFRLVPPRVLTGYLQEICAAEGVRVDPAALPLVVRAGAGSVRDSLSVLDQLLGGAAEDGVAYEQAASLLGYTPESLLDSIVDAFAAGDASGVFRTIDRVIEVGQDPRRFAEDLLRRLRDLVILSAVPSAIDDGILEVAGDQAERLKTQAAGLGAGELTRAAEVIAVGLTEMRGTTAPRLHLELMCARVLLPGADLDERGLNARMDRLERRVGMMGIPDDGSAHPAAAPRAAERHPGPAPARPQRDTAPAEWGNAQVAQEAPAARAERPAPGPAPTRPQEAPPAPPHPHAQPPADPWETPTAAGAPSPSGQRPAGAPPRQRPAGAPPSDGPTTPSTPASQGRSNQPARPGQLTTDELRRAWPAVLENVKGRRRFTYMLLSQNSQVVEVTDGVLVLGFANAGARDNFGSRGSDAILSEALIEVLGIELRIQAVVAGSSSAERQPHTNPAPAYPTPDPAASSPTPPPEPTPRPEPETDYEEAEVSADDEVFDGAQSAEELLGRELGAEIISVVEEE